MYLKTCLTCMKKNPVSRNEKGSKSFCDRFQLDLIDFRKLRKHDPFGVLMRWVLTIKDHATGLMYLCALPRKRPDLIAYKLQEIFGLIGYPKIFHTDNEKEFTTKSILKFLRHLNPNVLTVTGRPRRPRNQGSIENMNKFVKRVLEMVLSERREAGENPNWTEVLGSVAATINSKHGRGKNKVFSYEAVFGHQFNHALSCSKDEAHRCWTVTEHMQVTNDLDFKKYVHEYCDVDSEGHDTAEDDSSYFSDDDIPSDENEEVDDDYFNMHLMDSSTLPDNDNDKKEMDHPQDSLEFEIDSSVTVSYVFAQPNDN